jgi:hypothetical protein
MPSCWLRRAYGWLTGLSRRGGLRSLWELSPCQLPSSCLRPEFWGCLSRFPSWGGCCGGWLGPGTDCLELHSFELQNRSNGIVSHPPRLDAQVPDSSWVRQGPIRLEARKPANSTGEVIAVPRRSSEASHDRPSTRRIRHNIHARGRCEIASGVLRVR